MIFDVDGVFTDGKFLYSASGKQYKQFGAHDADGIKMLRAAEIELHVVSADKRGFAISERRMSDMGLNLILKNEQDRYEWIKSNFTYAGTGYMGDGHFDAQIFKIVEFPFAPNNAVKLARENAKYITESKGGEGAVYEAALIILGIIGGLS